MPSRDQATGEAASRLIDERVRELGGWRGETLARMRPLILERSTRRAIDVHEGEEVDAAAFRAIVRAAADLNGPLAKKR